ncbi:GNAT family N-acetyltransferase [Rummeliibacillus sp. TYF-LIM-RU47]|uniref:GNAT family N-acetyltransferase n=1 Tax=unclassified Rummeliibacillus TaxID=2622809 RepID=UPI00123905A3|nr:GNAT family N-acetyltransferase [Rummeliibacillus sp. TYF-LIM-RU47]
MNNWYTALKDYFPESELKSKEHFDKLLADKGEFYKVEEGPNFVLVYFEKEDFVFVDFILVYSGGRSKGTGSKVLNHLKQKKKPIILEVEPVSADSPDTRKRVRFYEKSGFRRMNDVEYTRIHPVTKEVIDLDLFYWSPTIKSPRWAIDTMETVYKEIHSYHSEEIYGAPPQAVEDILSLKEDNYRQAK